MAAILSRFRRIGNYARTGRVSAAGRRLYAEEGQTPQKLRLERGKEANDSQFPLESHFFTTNFMN